MSEVASPETSDTDAGSKHDRFIPVTMRRSRFVAAILFSAGLFWTMGWTIARPPGPHSAITLLGWGASPIAPMLGLLVLLIVAALVSMAITHPDTPHAGLFCALLGMCALAGRGGTIYPLLRISDDAATVHRVYLALAQECAMWAAILFIAELVTSRVQAKFCANSIWLERVAQNPEAFRMSALQHVSPLGFGLMTAISEGQANKLKKGEMKPMNGTIANFLALAAAVIVASILLPPFLQTQDKGQVLFAMFVAFGFAGLAANQALPQSNAWPILLCVPLTAAIGYFRAHAELKYPGLSVTSYARALPVDYIAAGVSGALFGYYASLRFRLSHLFSDEE